MPSVERSLFAKEMRGATEGAFPCVTAELRIRGGGGDKRTSKTRRGPTMPTGTIMTPSEAFTCHGVRLVNPQQSWSARAGDFVVLTFWQDYFRRTPEGRVFYSCPPLSATELGSPGFTELVKNVVHAMDHCGGIVGAVISRVKDPKADFRTALNSWPVKFMMRIVKFDGETGAFTAEQIAYSGAQAADSLIG
jgi:hypothetical protein